MSCSHLLGDLRCFFTANRQGLRRPLSSDRLGQSTAQPAKSFRDDLWSYFRWIRLRLCEDSDREDGY